jgi:glycosyltransferase involved in cell wall biosynthesis
MAAAANEDVTVVISCFNYGRFLPESVGSALSQEGGPTRVVVVDDGSTEPETLRALDELAGVAEVAVIHQQNAGASAARNAGLREAQTPYALVLDADDLIPRDAVRTLRAELEDDVRAGYAYGHMEFFGSWSGVMRMPDYDPWRLLFRHIVGPTALMRREMLQDTGGYDVSFLHYEDWEIWLHALATGWRGRQVDFIGLRQRKHGPSKFAGDRADYRRSFGRIRQKHRTLYGDLRRQAQISNLGQRERMFYRYVWGLRPWPAQVEAMLYSRLWRPSA